MLEILEATPTEATVRITDTTLERAWAIANELRTIFLSEFEGLAVAAIRVDGVEHEFSEIVGTAEGVPEIALQLKKLRLSGEAPIEVEVTVEKMGPDGILAGQIHHEHIEVLDPDLKICTVEKGNTLKMELLILSGKAYVSAELHPKERIPKGFLPIDSIFSPFSNVELSEEAGQVHMKISATQPFDCEKALKTSLNCLRTSLTDTLRIVEGFKILDSSQSS